MQAKTSKLAMAILALSLTQAVNASDSTLEHDLKNEGTYWGIGIGSVLGAVIAGPPGAAIGATLGGSIGWGKDQNDALDEGLTKLEQQKLALQQNTQHLQKSQQSINKYEQEIRSLKHTNALQSSGLKELEKLKTAKQQNTEFLKNLMAHYSQDIHFQIGQSNAPDHAQDRLASLVNLLNSHPELHVTLKGYTDSTGSKKLNEKIAQARVNSIKEVLKIQGVDETRITGLAIGEVQAASLEIKQASLDLKQASLDLKQETDQPEALSDPLLSDESELQSEKHLVLVSKIKPSHQDAAHARRVSIELSLVDSDDDQTLASNAALQP